ncbi:MAG: hypothetical protein PPP56_07890 [Longimonas sp.]|uniref:hypothetical protein n=1 Tax=Longimonas sp. TaxID=2039626 RepID=UPI003356FB4A
MTIRTFLPLFVAFALAAFVFPASVAAQSQCSDCVGSGSDIAGALFQGDGAPWSSSEARDQLNSRAAQLNALASTPDASRSMPPVVVDAFAAAPLMHALLRTEVADRAEQASIQDEWLAHGLPQPEADALINAIAGLTANDRIDPEALYNSLTVYNTAVESASEDFVAAPPASFVAVRHALHMLSESTL